MNKNAAKRIEDRYLKIIDELFNLNNAGEELFKNFLSLVHKSFKTNITFDAFFAEVMIGDLNRNFQIYNFTDNFIKRLGFIKRLTETLLKYDFINLRCSLKLRKLLSSYENDKSSKYL